MKQHNMNRRRDPELDIWPQYPDAEIGVIGSLLIDPTAFDLISEVLAPDDFYNDARRQIYTAICKLAQAGRSADYITVSSELERLGTLEQIEDVKPLTDYVSEVPTSGNILSYAQDIAFASELRECYKAAYYTGQDVLERDPETLQKAESRFFAIGQRNARCPTQARNHREALDDYMGKLDMLYERYQGKQNVITGVPTGFHKLDEMLSGLQPTDLITVAARPGVGKTSMLLRIAAGAISHGFSGVIFSLEMSEEQLIRRLLAAEASLDQAKMKLARIEGSEWDDLVAGHDRLHETEGTLWIEDSSTVTVSDIRSRVRRHMSEHPIDFILIDYAQLLKSAEKLNTRAEEVTTMLKALKTLARELHVPIVIAAQLSRAADGQVPEFSHLKDSGGFEEHSDIVCFLYTPKSDEEMKQARMHSLPYEVYLIVAKHRNGPIGGIKFCFIPKQTKFEEIEERNHHE